MKKILSLFILFMVSSCSSSKIITLATQGKIVQQEFNETLPFYYLKKHAFIDVLINGKPYTFLFDTGWDITSIDKSLYKEIGFSSIKKQKTSGSSFEDIKLEYGFIPSLQLGDINFQNIGVGIQDLSFIQSEFYDKRKIYGVIGTNILRKAYWQIDYKKQTIKFSNEIKNIEPASTAHKIPMIPKNSDGWGANRIKININGVVGNFIFDTGSYSNFTANNLFLEKLKKNKTPLLKETTIKSKSNTKRTFEIDNVEISHLELTNQKLMIEKNISLLIGNGFLENYIVTIDWFNNQLYLQ